MIMVLETKKDEAYHFVAFFVCIFRRVSQSLCSIAAT